MVNRPLRVVGIRVNGLITGYVEQDDVDDRRLSEQVIPFAEAIVITSSTPFQDVVSRLNQDRFLTVTALGQPVGVIVRNDLEKAPMRMWLFGMVTLVEMRITQIIRESFGNDAWTEGISKSRLEKAVQLQNERSRRNRSVDLIDCLQLGDKGQLLARSSELRERYWNRSRNRIEKVIKELERLRNNLAHSQDIITENWNAIVRLSETLDRILEAPENLPAKSSLTPYDELTAEQSNTTAE
ncbi:MAG: hypothetical protein ABGZ53_14850 [Fuerstiella sp.]